jgi:hypothetical protein
MPKKAGTDAAGVREGVEEMNASAGSPWKKQDWRWNLWVAIVTVVTGLLLAWVTDQLPQAEAGKRALMRSLTPLLTPTYDNTHQREITVATIDDLDLKKFDQQWPLTYLFLAQSVENILERRPQVLFIDLLLKRQGTTDDMEKLSTSICDRRGNTAVYIAYIADDMLPDSAMETHLFQKTDANGKPCVKWINPEITADEYDQSQWAYPASIKRKGRTGSQEGRQRSAAFEIFCDLPHQQCPDEKEEAPLALIWPTVAFDMNVQTMIRRRSSAPVVTGSSSVGRPENVYEAACREHVPPWETVPGVTVIRGWFQPEAKLRPCPYLRVMPLRALTLEAFSESDIDSSIAGRIVFLGANIVGSGDRIFSPVNGSLPGVHAHAMALNNLMAFHGQYKKAEGSRLFVTISVVCIVAMLTLWNHYFTQVEGRPAEVPTLSRQRTFLGRLSMLILFAPMLAAGWPRGRPTADPRARLLRRSAFFTLNLALVLILFVVGYVWLRQGPLSMVEYVFFPFVAHFIRVGKVVAERSRDWWHALWADNPWDAWARSRPDVLSSEH